MAVADASESDVESLRDTVATLSAEVGCTPRRLPTPPPGCDHLLLAGCSTKERTWRIAWN